MVVLPHRIYEYVYPIPSEKSSKNDYSSNAGLKMIGYNPEYQLQKDTIMGVIGFIYFIIAGLLWKFTPHNTLTYGLAGAGCVQIMTFAFYHLKSALSQIIGLTIVLGGLIFMSMYYSIK